jgi:sugar O-acyltransferase (sialic acid O-acetyltransferase NeuD family)|tara:strand:+ start:28057 stop:28656 length:600 start_codon:yes stop_codon:yes gene_type:complete
MSNNIIIIGAGGHGKVVGEIALLNEYKIIHFFDDRSNEIKKFPFKICGNLDLLRKNIKNYDNFFVAIGNNQIRYNHISWLKKEKKNIVSLIHPNSTISQFSSIGDGTCVMANVAINPGTFIREGVIINTSSSIDHDCLINDYAHISPNCSLSGNVSVGKFSHLGTGTSVHPKINIGDNVKTGIGSKVYKDILDNKIFKN